MDETKPVVSEKVFEYCGISRFRVIFENFDFKGNEGKKQKQWWLNGKLLHTYKSAD